LFILSLLEALTKRKWLESGCNFFQSFFLNSLSQVVFQAACFKRKWLNSGCSFFPIFCSGCLPSFGATGNYTGFWAQVKAKNQKLWKIFFLLQKKRASTKIILASSISGSISKMKKHFLPVALLLCATPVAAQPATKPAKTKAAKTTRVAGTAYIRVLHAMPGGPSVDVYSGSTKIASNLSFKSLGEYMDVKSGKNTIKITPVGKTEPSIVSEDKSLTKGKFFTLAITGKQKAALLFVNDSTGKEMTDKARIRVVHLAPGAPDVLVTVPSTRGDKGYANLIAKPLEYQKSASKTVKPMSATIQIRTQDGKLVKEVSDVQLQAGKRYDAFAVGEVGSSFDVLVKPAATK